MKVNAPILAAEISARETWVMTAWVGLAGVIAGAIIAFAGQDIMRRGDKRERFDALLLEQFADIIALSEDFRNRIWEERKQVASDVVGKWDLGAYRHAEARLRILSQEPNVKTALETLHEAGANLGDTWRTESGDKATIDSALTAHRDAIEQLLAVGSQIIRHRAAI
jgi:hypothetical protein